MAGPPTGTVTFLFTDIEGSTRLWERSPEAMSEALARHDEILRQAIETKVGFVFKMVGDAEESLKQSRDLAWRILIMECLYGLGAVAGARGMFFRAARLWGAADAVGDVTGHTLPSQESARHEPYVAARSRLGEAVF